MSYSRFRWLTAALVSGSCLATVSTEALAQAYPTRPVRLFVACAAGGPSDLVGRTVAQKLSESLSQARAAPDVRARLISFNMDPMISTLEAFADFINTAIETWGRVFKRANISPE